MSDNVGACGDCGTVKSLVKCEAGQKCGSIQICESCQFICGDCNKIICVKDQACCDGCGGDFCYDTCSDYCAYCESNLCSEHLKSDYGIEHKRDSNGDIVCGACVENGKCASFE